MEYNNNWYGVRNNPDGTFYVSVQSILGKNPDRLGEEREPIGGYKTFKSREDAEQWRDNYVAELKK